MLLWHMRLAGELDRQPRAPWPKMDVRDVSLAELGRPSPHHAGPRACQTTALLELVSDFS